MAVHPACQPIATKIAALVEERKEAWADLKQALADGDIQGKWAAARRAANAARQIQERARQLEACEVAHGARAPLGAVFVGTGEFTGTHPEIAKRVAADGPFKFPVRLDLWFNALRTTLQITAFQPIPVDAFEQDTPIGRIELNVTVTMRPGTGYGSYDAAAGAIFCSPTLIFNVAEDLPIYEEDSELPLTLYTSHPEGSAVDANGNVTIAGTGTFVGGSPGTLVGSQGTVICRGKISPHP